MEQKKEYDIFISYRRFDSEGRASGRDIARAIKLEFEKRGYVVFFDYSEIKDDEFEHIIIPAIENAKFFVLVLSKDALVRCANEGDWVRREVETAIAAECKIIPVNPDDAFEGWPTNLPDTIMPITKQQISEISMGFLFEKSIDKLVEERLSKKKDDISIGDINTFVRKKSKSVEEKIITIKSTWYKRHLLANVLFCIYLLLVFFLLFVFAEILNHNFKEILDLSMGFYTITFLYGIYQFFLNRRDGLYIILLCPIVTVLIGYFFYEREVMKVITLSVFMYIFAIPLFCSLFLRKEGKRVWQQMQGGIFCLVRIKRHYFFYLWCIVWIAIVIYKTHFSHY